jgi:cysteinyl-tRNA synthetase
VIDALCDDLNTPNVITRLHALMSEVRAARPGSRQLELQQSVKASGAMLGLLQRTQREYMSAHPKRMSVDESKVRSLIEARTNARRTKNFAQADTIRAQLADMGVEIEDHKDGTTSWKIRRRAS